MRTDYLNKALLNAAYRNTAFTSPATVYASLLSAVTAAKAGTVTEATWTGLVRVAAAFAAPIAGSGGWKIQNSGTITFVQNPSIGSGVVVPAIGIYDALTVGNLLDVIFLDATGSTPIEATTVDTAGGVWNAPAHTMLVNQQVRLMQRAGQVLPTNFAADTTYFVIAAGLTANAFELSATQGGAAIVPGVVGEALILRLTPITMNPSDTPQFAANALSLFDN